MNPHSPATPPRGTPARDLTDAELEELDGLLDETPEPLEPLDIVMLDGYLCGVLVQPSLVPPEQWLPRVFDVEGRPLPEGTDPAWRERVSALLLRHHAALNRAMAEDGWFDPIVIEFERGEPDEAASEDDPLAAMPPVSRSLFPWVTGFQLACEDFPSLLEIDDDAVMTALARIFRHLPPESDEEREVVETLEREQPLADLDEGLEDLVAAVADLWDLTSDDRYRVEQVRHDRPKVGRNDPCPCGSGKKYKHCHGA